MSSGLATDFCLVFGTSESPSCQACCNNGGYSFLDNRASDRMLTCQTQGIVNTCSRQCLEIDLIGKA